MTNEYLKTIIIAAMMLSANVMTAQKAWTVNQCMKYAVEHNHDIRTSTLDLDNYKATKSAAIGSFLPDVDGSIGTQYNFGRAIDPETNTYTDVSTFYNSYSLSSTLPVFDGFERVHALKAAKADVLMGKSSLKQLQNETALDVFQAFVNVLYYQGTSLMAEEKLKESEMLLHQTEVMEEVGRKSLADVAQMEAQMAEADCELTRQNNLLSSAMLTLKALMNYPLDDSLTLDNGILFSWEEGDEPKAEDFALEQNAGLKKAYYSTKSSYHNWKQAISALYPTIYVGAGLGTTYYKTLHSQSAQSFNHQLRNNMGEYIAASISIPIFNRLSSINNIRKAKNNFLKAQEEYEKKRTELYKLSAEALQDHQGYVKETRQMIKKVAADSVAYMLTKRKFEEGLATAIDLKTNSATLLNSKASLLRSKLMAILKRRLVQYYFDETVID